MTFEEVWNSGLHISQSIFKEEGEVLYNSLLDLPENSVILEIGSYVGRSAHLLATIAKLKNSKLICIDPFLPAFDGWENADPKTAFLRNVLNVFDNVTLIEDYSQNVADKVGSVDFIFIDGDHSYEGVKSDCELYIPKLKNGCKIGFHDYFNPSFEGVKRAVDEYCNGWQIVGTNLSIIVFKKNE